MLEFLPCGTSGRGNPPPQRFLGNLGIWLVLPARFSDCSFGLGALAKHLTPFRIDCT